MIWAKRKRKWRMLVAGMLAACCLCSSAAAAQSLPIVMYHDLTQDENATNKMTVTVERFRLDMEFLKEFGYTALLPADLIAIKQGTQQMPQKPIMITFDDGYRSNYDWAYPVLQQTGMKAAIAVVAYNIKPQAEASETRHSMTWEEVKEMADSGVVEIGLHTYNLHNPKYSGNAAPDGINGVMRLRGETESAYRQRVGTDLKMGIERIRQYSGQEVRYFCYPFGAYDYWMQPLLEENGFLVSTLTKPATASISSSLYNLPRYTITMENSIPVLLRQREKATPSQAAVTVNGEQHTLIAYNIGGNNYVRVRDVATLLKDTASGFDVRWNEQMRRVELASFTPYTPIGSENEPLPAGQRTVQSIIEPTAADGSLHMIAAFNIDGCTYYKLRSLGELCAFAVDWDEASHTVLITA